MTKHLFRITRPVHQSVNSCVYLLTSIPSYTFTGRTLRKKGKDLTRTGTRSVLILIQILESPRETTDNCKGTDYQDSLPFIVFRVLLFCWLVKLGCLLGRFIFRETSVPRTIPIFFVLDPSPSSVESRGLVDGLTPDSWT